MNLADIQAQLRAERLDGWLLFDHHQRDPIAYRILGLHVSGHVSRRWYYWIPASGEPAKLAHRIEPARLDALPGPRRLYSSWQEQHAQLGELLGGARRVAMQYSPNCMIPYVSLVDGGTIDLVRSLGVEVLSSASLVQYFEARWSAEQWQSHQEAGRRVDRVRAEAFQEIVRRLARDGSASEHEIAQFIRQRFREEGLRAEDGPIVAADANSGNPHYEPTPQQSATIRPGSVVLLDMWAKLAQPNSVYYDITWTGFCGESPPAEVESVFRIVTAARDSALEFVRGAIERGETIAGWQVDDVARQLIRERGFGDAFTHRLGHSIGQEVHGNGANLDNLETRDERPLVAGTCFSIEPGIYLPTFGIRTEIDCYVSERTAQATGEVQRELVRIQ